MRFTIQFLTAFIFSLSISLFAKAQDTRVATWQAKAEKTADGNYRIVFSGTVKKGWHIYTAADKENDLSGITVSKDDSIVTLKEMQLITKGFNYADPVFAKQLQVATDSISFSQNISIAGEVPSVIELNVNYETGDAQSFFPESDTLKIATGAAPVETVSNRILIPAIDADHPLTDCKTSSSISVNDQKGKSLLSVFLLGLVGGIVSLFLPCLFPMIPLTVSFFTNKAKSRRQGVFNAFMYGFFIFLIYVLITLPFHFAEHQNPAIFNNVSTNVYLNSAFFAIFIFFAFSFFGFYEITLPSRFSNKADSKANAGTIWGIFFMALTLTIVSFSCTGPIAGSLLAGVAGGGEGGAMRLTFGMAGFGVAIGLPFALFALFPNMLKSLPKSGGWLHTVKVVLGFLELAFAFKFLSNADLVMHWGILKREIFIGIWIIIGCFLSLYLWGMIGFKADPKRPALSWFRIAAALFFSAFTLYLIPGVTNTKYANLRLISGFPPPLYYSIYAKKSDMVLDLNGSHDYETGLKMAREQHKVILLDFTGYACVNCRRMEENVWSDPKVYALMKEKFIVISLYVDDKKPLSAADRFTYTSKDGTKRQIRTVGDKWATFETENFRQNSQPLYAIINTDEKLLTHPAGYTPSVNDYLQWLQCGVNAGK